MLYSNRKILVVIILYLFFVGCMNFSKLDGQQGLENYAAEGKEKLSEMRKYIGKSREDVQKFFGKPTDVASPAWFKNIRFDEEWYYKYDKGIPIISPNEHTMSFYFQNGKVVSVDAL